jgi:hypothetical protein
MLMYVLIGLSLVLVGIAGLQFTYLYWADRLNAERKKYIQDLEEKYKRTLSQLEFAERRIAEQDALLDAVYADLENEEDEAWADVIEER